MARITPVTENELKPSVKVALERHIQEYQDRVTNMKGTLGHSLLAFEVYMQWYPLYQEVEKILGKRLAYLYAYAISQAGECQLCAAFFHKRIVDAGENPDNVSLTTSQRNVLDFGRSIAKHKGNIADHLYNEVAEKYSKSEMVLLVAFAGQMIAANIFNNVVETEVDEYLIEYVPSCKYQ